MAVSQWKQRRGTNKSAAGTAPQPKDHVSKKKAKQQKKKGPQIFFSSLTEYKHNHTLYLRIKKKEKKILRSIMYHVSGYPEFCFCFA